MTNLPLSEATLVQRARAGELDAFTALVDTHADRIYRGLRSFGLDAAEAEEVAQEVFVRAWRGIARFEGRSKFSTWLYRLAFNEADRWRSRRPPRAVSLDLAEQDAIHPGPDSPPNGPEDRALQHELQSAIARALAQLPASWRLAVVLRDIEGLSTEEAAEVAGIRVAAFKSRLHRGRMQLRLLLESYLDIASQTTDVGSSTRRGAPTGRRPTATSGFDG